MVGAKSFRRLISQGRSLIVLCAILLATWFFPAVIGVSAVHAQGYGYPLLSAPDPIHPMGDQIPRVYIPLIIVFKEAGIYGYVTQSGVPAAGVTLDLYLRVINNDSPISSVLTNTNGYYSFIGVPGISSGTGQGYFVRFSKTSGNNNTPGRLYYWETRVLQTYTKDEAVRIGDFDIGDVMLGEPNLPDDPLVPSLTLPVAFYWTKRSLVPSDSYVFYITEYIPNPSPVYNLKYQSPPLGFIDSKLITSNDLPVGLVPGKLYYWYLSIVAPDGAIGAVSVMHGVKFANPR